MERQKPPDYFKSVKIPLKHILKNPDINLDKINHAVLRSNKIVIHTYQFMKLYLLNYYEQNNKKFTAPFAHRRSSYSYKSS